jgi:hypothetical protein
MLLLQLVLLLLLLLSTLGQVAARLVLADQTAKSARPTISPQAGNQGSHGPSANLAVYTSTHPPGQYPRNTANVTLVTARTPTTNSAACLALLAPSTPALKARQVVPHTPRPQLLSLQDPQRRKTGTQRCTHLSRRNASDAELRILTESSRRCRRGLQLLPTVCACLDTEAAVARHALQ